MYLAAASDPTRRTATTPLAADGKGASRMSAYVNMGMICPYRMARDARAAGSDKFVDEFCGFRESAHLWCLLHPAGYADAKIAVPAWARQQLARHEPEADDDASATPGILELEAGRSGDSLWDDCQRCLVLSGELHNNVRMAWGKAIPAWHAAALDGAIAPAAQTLDPLPKARPPPSAVVRLQAALDLLIHLNDKFALDGGAPPSYGGLLWCLGWRDRPGQDGRPTARPTSVIGKRIRAGDLERRAKWRCGGQRLAHALASVASSSSPSATAQAASQAAPEAQAASQASAEVLATVTDSTTSAPSAATTKRNRDETSADGPAPTDLASDRAAKAARSGHAASSVAQRSAPTKGSLWHFLNRESASALPGATKPSW